MSTNIDLTRLMHMDDIKLFPPNDTCLQQLVDTVRKFSNDIRMSFGFEKSGPIMSHGDEIGELSYGQTYCYLGFPETGSVDHGTYKELITAEVRRRSQLIWGSLLNGQFKVMATNAFCIPLLSYEFGIVDWTKVVL